MKCYACKYEHEEGLVKNEWVTLKGDVKFIDLKEEFSYEQIENYEPITYYTTLRACPKCGTVRIV